METGQKAIRDIKPVLSANMAEALALFRRDTVPDDAAVHDIRVLMKKCRAIFKLISPGVGDAVYLREYSVFRDTGRALAALRESSVHRKTLKSLGKNHKALFRRLEANDRIRPLLEMGEKPICINGEGIPGTGNTFAALGKSAFRIRFMPLKNLAGNDMFRNLMASYNAVCESYLACRISPRPASLHFLRKRVKDLLYQLYFFRDFNPGKVRSMERKLDGIAQNLGSYNDLAQLEKVIGYDARGGQRFPEMDELMIVIRDRQDKYLAKIWPVAFGIFCPGHDLSDILGFSSRSFQDEAVAETDESGKDDL